MGSMYTELYDILISVYWNRALLTKDPAFGRQANKQLKN